MPRTPHPLLHVWILAGLLLGVAGCGSSPRKVATPAPDTAPDTASAPDTAHDTASASDTAPDTASASDTAPDTASDTPPDTPPDTVSDSDTASPPDTPSDTPAELPCQPDCAARPCGGNGCGGSCGPPCTCGDGSCTEGETAAGCPVDCGSCGDGVCGAREAGGAAPACLKDCHPTCGDGKCELGEGFSGCPVDCGFCGDDVCAADEDPNTCFSDCFFACGDGKCGGFFEDAGTCPKDCPPKCGDKICDPGEDVWSCLGDCGACGDGLCAGSESPESCFSDCHALCGDGLCQGEESPAGCPADCGACGDGVCGIGESPSACALDCPASCGDGACAGGESPESCPADCACLPQCGGRECGTDTCGNLCGLCPALATCTEDGQCACDVLPCGDRCCGVGEVCDDIFCCLPSCTGKECGGDGCGGSCGGCGADEVCKGGGCACAFASCAGACCPKGQPCFDGACCLPQCDGKECGDDGCGGSCGDCPFAHACEAGACVFQVFCGNGACEPEAEAAEDCGSCPADCACAEGSVCLDGACCAPQCQGSECGDDGCGGSCGDCQSSATCEGGQCLCDFEACEGVCCAAGEICFEGACCKASCGGKECGGDGCGGSCGDCQIGALCNGGRCECDALRWQRTHGDGGSAIYGVDIAGSGAEAGIVFVGKKDTAASLRAFWVARTGLGGTLKWEALYNGPTLSMDVGFGIAGMDDGGAVACGLLDKRYPKMDDAYAVRLDGSGAKLWSRLLGGKGFDVFYGAARAPGGGVLCAGQTFSGTHYRGWLVDFGVAGGATQASATVLKSSAFDILKGISAVSAGGYVAAGSHDVQGLANDDYVGGGRLWLVRLSESLGVTWHKSFGTASAEGYAVVEAPAGGFLVVGYTTNPGTGRDLYVVRTDAAGAKLWDHVRVSAGDDVARDAVVTDDGHFLVVGYVAGSGRDLFLLELDDSGQPVWQRTLGGGGTQAAYAVTPLPGQPKRFIVGGEKSLSGWLLEIERCTPGAGL